MMKIKISKGFTIIELLIVVAIVGILASIGYPQYNEYIIRASRAEAMVLLLDAANKQEQFFVDNRTYASNLADIGVPNATENGYYNITINVPADGLTFVLTASAALGAAANDGRCRTLTINEIGVKGSTGTADDARDCWER